MSFQKLCHIMSFEALTSGKSDCFGLIPCYIGETPSVAIAMFFESRAGVDVVPLFVALTGDIDLTIPDYQHGRGDSEGGQASEDMRDLFATNAAMTDPG